MNRLSILHEEAEEAARMSRSHEELLECARRAAERAYCPYSRFRVGACAMADDGRVFDGCNVENASYGLTICAERVAIFSAVASGAQRITTIAVSCLDGSIDSLATLMPCGACRQVMQEFCAPDAHVLVEGVGEFTLDALLPSPFRLSAPR